MCHLDHRMTSAIAVLRRITAWNLSRSAACLTPDDFADPLMSAAKDPGRPYRRSAVTSVSKFARGFS